MKLLKMDYPLLLRVANFLLDYSKEFKNTGENFY